MLGALPGAHLHQCECGSYGGRLDGHETCRMETIAEDAESEYELGNCVVQIGVNVCVC
jgi:hypothetical protein